MRTNNIRYNLFCFLFIDTWSCKAKEQEKGSQRRQPDYKDQPDIQMITGIRCPVKP